MNRVQIYAYLFGVLIGEVALLAKWGMAQPEGARPSEYVRARWPHMLLSLCVALAACLAWAEGSLARYLPDSLEATAGISVVVGAVLSFGAHGVIGIVQRKTGTGDQP